MAFIITLHETIKFTENQNIIVHNPKKTQMDYLLLKHINQTLNIY